MASPKGEKAKNRPIVLEGEPVLTFQQGKIRKGECIQGDVEDIQVKYLVRYPTGNRNDVPSSSGLLVRRLRSPPPCTRSWLSLYGSGSSSSRPLGLSHGTIYNWFLSLRMKGASTSSLATGFHCPVAPEWEYQWVPEGRVLRYTILHRQKDSDAALQMAAKGLLPVQYPIASSGAQVTEGVECPSGAPEVQPPSKCKQKRGTQSEKGRWGGKDPTKEPEHMCLGKLEVQIRLPKALKLLLLQDWKLVTVKKQLFSLPAKKPVSDILAEYLAAQQNCTTAFKTYAISELVLTFQEFFDMVLGSQLLYRFERLQHLEIQLQHPRARMSHLYGGAHLLRLFPQLGLMLSCAPLEAGSVQVLLSHLQYFLKYFASNPSLLFKAITDYKMASVQYLQRTC